MQAVADRRSALDTRVRVETGQTQVVQDDDGFAALRADWNELADQMSPPSPFHSWEWAFTWWQHQQRQPQGAASSLEIVTFRNEVGALIGLAPFYRRHIGPRRLGPTTLLPIGWERGRGWSVTEQLELLFPDRDRALLLTALSDWLQATRWSVAALPAMHETDAVPPWLLKHTLIKGSTRSYLYRALPGSWDEFVQSLNKSMRDNVKYYPRLLLRDGHELVFAVASNPDEIAESLPVLFHLHRARAHAPMRVEHRDYFATLERREFFEDVGQALAARGAMKIGLLYVDEVPVAAQMWFENRGVMFMYYSGYAPEWARYSVGLVATLGAVKSGIRRGMHQVEFLAGRGQFKERWDPERRSRFNITLAAHPAALRPVFALKGVRRWIRRLS